MISCMEQPWAAIRRSDSTGEEFIDMSLIDMDQSILLKRVAELGNSHDSWDRKNQIIRISRCVITETPGRVR